MVALSQVVQVVQMKPTLSFAEAIMPDIPFFIRVLKIESGNLRVHLFLQEQNMAIKNGNANTCFHTRD